MNDFALDASGVIAAVLTEPQSGAFEEILSDGVCHVSTVNLAEVVGKFAERGMPVNEIEREIGRFSLVIEPFTVEDAWQCGLLRPLTRSAGLSLGDRACIALAMRLGLPAVTMDRAWATLDLPVTVVVARP